MRLGPLYWGEGCARRRIYNCRHGLGAAELLCRPYIDRRAEEREQAEWVRTALEDPRTLYVLGSGTRHLMYTQPEPRIAFLEGEMAAAVAGRGDPSRLVLPRVVSGAALCPRRARERDSPRAAAADPLRAAAACLPRLDPAIIVLVTDGERALLGRQGTWPPGRYSTIAGFVEPGESLEDAVAREVMEETGVPVTGSRYESSQPWPFPASIMLGFRAQARPDNPVRVDGELEDARWFTREQIRAGGAALLPFSHSISRRLIVEWLEEQPSRDGTTP